MHPIARALLLSILIVLLGFVAFSYLSGSAYWRDPRTKQPAGAVGSTGAVDTERARERGAEVGEKVAVATVRVRQTLEEAALTTKIKAKMVLDDSVKARSIDVTTNGSTVTLSGTVASRAEHDRAVALARETAGVSQVVDHLTVER